MNLHPLMCSAAMRMKEGQGGHGVVGECSCQQRAGGVFISALLGISGISLASSIHTPLCCTLTYTVTAQALWQLSDDDHPDGHDDCSCLPASRVYQMLLMHQLCSAGRSLSSPGSAGNAAIAGDDNDPFAAPICCIGSWCVKVNEIHSVTHICGMISFNVHRNSTIALQLMPNASLPFAPTIRYCASVAANVCLLQLAWHPPCFAWIMKAWLRVLCPLDLLVMEHLQ